MTNINGFLLIDKPKNITSYGVIKEVKKQGISKIGHTGTLDPNTTGLLVLAIGQATKFIPLLTINSQKEYIAKMKFGLKTSTGDITGEIIEQKKVSDFNEKKIYEAFNNYIGKYKQVPPKYSAKKINGKRAYKLAQEGKEINMTNNSKEVEIYNIDILNIDFENLEVEFKALVSKGTYIRSLIEDVASHIKQIATMTELRRTKTDGFNIEQASEIKNIDLNNIINLDEFLKEKYKYKIEVEGRLAQLLKNGIQINNENIIQKFDKITIDGNLLVIDKLTNKIIAIYTKEDEMYKPVFMLWS